ncbi:hypothetical protein [Erwinia sp. SLM-02]|uniref:hypothetical protein n=1 Tax=Erwinia sp. SLM-02 TaxID=3020057 RepID=UPI0030800474
MMKLITPYHRTLALLLLLSGLAGCQAKKPQTTAKVQAEETLVASSSGREQMDLCFNQLEALKAMHSTRYPALMAEFNQLMAGAAKYGNVRKKISHLNQDTGDAFYRFRANVVCSKIDGALLSVLSEQAGPSS